MKMLKILETNILNSWKIEGKGRDPYEYILDTIGNMTTNFENYVPQIKELLTNGFISDFSDAIANGFDDPNGFAFFYLIKYLLKSNILNKMSP